MDARIIDKYIANYSSIATRNKAKDIFPQLTVRNEMTFQLTCAGTAKKPYNILIDLEDGAVKDTRCSCPFDYGGICKHIIASLDLIKDQFIPVQELPFAWEPSVHKPKGNELLLKDGVIDIKSVAAHAVRDNYNSSATIISVSPTEIQTVAFHWSSTRQVFSYNKETKILTTSCTCSQIAKFCEHRYLALSHIIEVFDPAIFTENYIDTLIEPYLKKFGLTLEDNYKPLFDFKLTPQGLMVKSKYKNLKPVNTTPTVLAVDEETGIKAALPYLDVADRNYGLCICFEYYDNQLSALIPVRAKYNKLKTDFSSSFSPIYGKFVTLLR